MTNGNDYGLDERGLYGQLPCQDWKSFDFFKNQGTKT